MKFTIETDDPEEMRQLMRARTMENSLNDIEMMFRQYRKYEDLPPEQEALLEKMTKELREILDES